jgi:arylsulfatase A-like enzyme
LDALNDSKFKENTIVVLTSDHGWQMGQKQYLFKNSPWESSTHIPLVVRAPGVEAGSKVKQPVSLIDIYPTLTDLCSLTANNRKNESGFSVDGFSLKTFLEDPNSRYWEGSEGALTAIATNVVDYELAAQTFAFRTQDYRYILYPNGSEELYALKSDANEWNNLALDNKYNDTKEGLRNKVLGIINK